MYVCMYVCMYVYIYIYIYGKKIKTVHFGASGYTDYIKSGGDDERKKRYIARHSNGKEDWDMYMTPGSLSRWILWSKPTLKESIKDYKKMFNLL